MKTGTTTHPKFRRLQKRLKLPTYAVAGLLELLWMMASFHKGRIPYSNQEIADYLDWQLDSLELVSSLIEAKLLSGASGDYRLIHLDRRDLKTSAWRLLRLEVLAERGTICAYCGSDCVDDPTIDHVVPFVCGGTIDKSNLVVSCRSCNSKKGAK